MVMKMTNEKNNTDLTLRAFYTHALKKRKYTDEHSYYDVPDRDGPWAGSPGETRYAPPTIVYLPGKFRDKFHIPVVEGPENWLWEYYVGPVSVVDNLSGAMVTDKTTLEAIAQEL